MLAEEKVMEVLEAYDLTGSYRSAAALCGVDHHTVRRFVAARAAGLDTGRVARPRVSDPFADKISEWIDRSQGRVRSGIATIGALATAVTFDHGLDIAPGLEDVQVTALGSLGAASQFWVSAVNPTSITLNVDAAPGSDVSFAWQVG